MFQPLRDVLAERLLNMCLISTKSFLLILEQNVSKLRSNSRAARRAGRASCIAPTVPWIAYGALSLTDDPISAVVRTSAAWMHVNPLQRSRRAGTGAVIAPGSRLYCRAIQGKGVNMTPTNLPGARRSAV